MGLRIPMELVTEARTDQSKGVRIIILLLVMSLYFYCGQLIGLIPEENIFKQMDRHRPLAAYLSSRLGMNVRLTILSRYGDIIDRFETRNMDGAFFSALTGVLAVEK
jgi:hypothetical protein